MTQDIIRIACIGIGATLIMDAWLVLLRRLGVPTLNFAFIGRWVGHLPRGRFFHDAIAKAQPVPGEAALGWITHYAIGIAFAALLVILAGSQWQENPTALPAVLVGLGTVAAPLLVMQPAMGAGVLASRTATPLRNCLRSLVNHGVFGFGLFLAAALYQHIGG